MQSFLSVCLLKSYLTERWHYPSIKHVQCFQMWTIVFPPHAHFLWEMIETFEERFLSRKGSVGTERGETWTSPVLGSKKVNASKRQRAKVSVKLLSVTLCEVTRCTLVGQRQQLSPGFSICYRNGALTAYTGGRVASPQSPRQPELLGSALCLIRWDSRAKGVSSKARFVQRKRKQQEWPQCAKFRREQPKTGGTACSFIYHSHLVYPGSYIKKKKSSFLKTAL